MKSFVCIVLFALVAASFAEDQWAADELNRLVRSVYGGSSYGGYSAPAPALHPGPATSHSYPSYAPTVPCAKNLLLSCAPSVAPVPCAAPAYGHSNYGHSNYGHSSYGHGAVSYGHGGYDGGHMLGATHVAEDDKKPQPIPQPPQQPLKTPVPKKI